MRIVDDLLDIGRITRGAFSIHPQRVDLRDIVARAVEAARPGIDSARPSAEHRSAARAGVPAGRRAARDPGAHQRAEQRGALHRSRAARSRSRCAASGRTRTTTKSRISWPGRRFRCAIPGAASSPSSSAASSACSCRGAMRPAARRAASAWASRWRAPSSSCTTAPSRRKARARARAASSSSGYRWRRAGQAAAAGAAEAAGQWPGLAVARRVLVVDDNVDAAAMLAALIRQLGHEVADRARRLGGAAGGRRLPPGSDPARHRHAGNERLRGGAAAARAGAQSRSCASWRSPDGASPRTGKRSREAGFDMHLIKPVELSEIQQALLLNGASSTKH